jgi:hypothetical protein
MKYELKLEFKEPVNGYWDNGKKAGGDFSSNMEFERGGTANWGSLYLNFWFCAGMGKSEYEAASIARRKLLRICRVPCTIEIVERDSYF